MRSKSKLYQIILDRFKEETKKDIHSFICHVISDCYIEGKISEKECEKIMKDFENQKPSPRKHKEFFKHELFMNSFSWWISGSEGNKQRIAFLEKLIAKK